MLLNKQNTIVRKPWGYEYVAYQNDIVSLWVLHINKNERTSLHCHPNKGTGLVILKGSAKIRFIADETTLEAPAKKMIRRGLFHQTEALSDLIMLEIETSTDKEDLVRLQDNYGRQNKGYERNKEENPIDKNSEYLQIRPDINKYYFADREITVEQLSDIDNLYSKKSSDIVMFLKGGLFKTIDGRKHHVLQPGDVGTVEVVTRVAQEMSFMDDTMVLYIK